MVKPKVSIWMITYNHEFFIRQAIDSILSQQTDFDFELVIGEDCSTDNTRKICEEYAFKHPKVINLLPSVKNLGVNLNLKRTIDACEGKYIAMCEGDDYWIDPYKLQKQVRVLEELSHISLVYSNVTDLNDVTGELRTLTFDDPTEIDLVYLIKRGWFIRTPTIMFRNDLLEHFPKFYLKTYATDYFLQLLLAQHGKLYRIEDNTAVYRRHPSGISNSSTTLLLINRKLSYLKYLKYFHDNKKEYKVLLSIAYRAREEIISVLRIVLRKIIIKEKNIG